jgi:hypothetical protein
MMQYQGYSFEVKAYRIIPPIGRTYPFGGKAYDMHLPNGQRAGFFEHEYLGKTEDEVINRACAGAKAWIDGQLAKKTG